MRIVLFKNIGGMDTYLRCIPLDIRHMLLAELFLISPDWFENFSELFTPAEYNMIKKWNHVIEINDIYYGLNTQEIVFRTSEKAIQTLEDFLIHAHDPRLIKMIIFDLEEHKEYRICEGDEGGDEYAIEI